MTVSILLPRGILSFPAFTPLSDSMGGSFARRRQTPLAIRQTSPSKLYRAVRLTSFRIQLSFIILQCVTHSLKNLAADSIPNLPRVPLDTLSSGACHFSFPFTTLKVSEVSLFKPNISSRTYHVNTLHLSHACSSHRPHRHNSQKYPRQSQIMTC